MISLNGEIWLLFLSWPNHIWWWILNHLISGTISIAISHIMHTHSTNPTFSNLCFPYSWESWTSLLYRVLRFPWESCFLLLRDYVIWFLTENIYFMWLISSMILHFSWLPPSTSWSSHTSHFFELSSFLLLFPVPLVLSLVEKRTAHLFFAFLYLIK